MTRVLLVEDDPDVAEAIAEGLRPVGCHVTVCGTYAAAIDALKHLPFEALISDGKYPIGTARVSPVGPYGIPLLLEAKTLGKAIIFLSGDDDLVQEAKVLGIPALTKPATVNQILQAVDRQTAEIEYKKRMVG